MSHKTKQKVRKVNGLVGRNRAENVRETTAGDVRGESESKELSKKQI